MITILFGNAVVAAPTALVATRATSTPVKLNFIKGTLMA